MNVSKKGLTKAMRSGDSIIRAESREPKRFGVRDERRASGAGRRIRTG